MRTDFLPRDLPVRDDDPYIDKVLWCGMLAALIPAVTGFVIDGVFALDMPRTTAAACYIVYAIARFIYSWHTETEFTGAKYAEFIAIRGAIQAGTLMTLQHHMVITLCISASWAALNLALIAGERLREQKGTARGHADCIVYVAPSAVLAAAAYI